MRGAGKGLAGKDLRTGAAESDGEWVLLFFPDGGKLVQGLTGTTNKFGDPRATTEQALWAAVGVNFYGMDPEHTRASNLLAMSRKVQNAENRLKSKLYDRSLTEEQRAKAVGDYKERMLELGQEAKKYAEESQVPEAVKARK